MLGQVSQQLLTLLQITRMALAFTAISNALAGLALRSRATGDEALRPTPMLVLATVAVAIGLYGFGMTLNDIIDRRRDRHLARGRPLPSGRIGVGAATIVAAALLVVAIAGGWLFYQASPPGDLSGAVSLLLVLVTAGLIASYDLFGKYLVGLGLLSLGLIRFFHAIVPAPQMPVVWHPLWLLNHVTIVSAVAYRWEAKRPPLSRNQVFVLLGGLALVDALLVGAMFWRRGADFAWSMKVSWPLVLPVVASVAFAVVAAVIKGRANDRRAAGKTLILYGLLWLIIYDALFVAGYVDVWLGVALLAFWPISYLAVRAMRAWASMTDLARRPEYVRADQTSLR